MVENNIIAWLNISFYIQLLAFNHYLTKMVTLLYECNTFVKNLY